MTPALYRSCAEAVHVIAPDGCVLRGGQASLYVLERIGYGWQARLLARPPLRWCVEGGYRLVAANRSFFARFFFRDP